jgi:cytochrome b6-f complex iron-sulfur subunit
MERRRFFSLLGAGTAAVVLSRTLESCSKDSSTSPGTSQNVDFTLDLSSSTYSALKTAGNSTQKDNIIIAHTTSDEYIALSEICTHQSCSVNFDGSTAFVCPCHGSMFAKDGSVTRGPAQRALTRYNTSLNGNSLRVYS